MDARAAARAEYGVADLKFGFGGHGLFGLVVVFWGMGRKVREERSPMVAVA